MLYDEVCVHVYFRLDDAELTGPILKETYPSPKTFNPDRFLKDGALNPDVQDPRLLAFGFGRR
jgi:hypothetical protein